MTRLHLCAQWYPHTRAHTNPMQLKASRTWPAAPNKAPADLDCSVCRVTSICFPVTLRVFVRSSCARKGWQRLRECVRVHPACARASRRAVPLPGPSCLDLKVSAGKLQVSSLTAPHWECRTGNEQGKLQTLYWKRKEKEAAPINWLQMRAADASIFHSYFGKENVPFHMSYRCTL